MNVTFQNLQKSFDGRKVLDLEQGLIKSGSRTAIIGPNGAGKSTLLRIIAGLEPADSGVLSYDDSTGFPRMDITMVFQKPYLISTTVEKNIAYPMKLRGYEPALIEQRTEELMEELNLTGLRKQKAWKLSGGETQKVALARALSFQPKLLLLDEPTANIDPYTTAEIEKMLLSIGTPTDSAPCTAKGGMPTRSKATNGTVKSDRAINRTVMSSRAGNSAPNNVSNDYMQKNGTSGNNVPNDHTPKDSAPMNRQNSVQKEQKRTQDARQGTTIVLITHNLAQAKRVCDEVMMLHEGKLIEAGSCEKVLLDPQMQETRRFVEGELLI